MAHELEDPAEYKKNQPPTPLPEKKGQGKNDKRDPEVMKPLVDAVLVRLAVFFEIAQML